jgi:hypothetical protein
MKKIMSLIMAGVFLVGTIPVMASEKDENRIVYSEEFPDAYIIVNEINPNTNTLSETQEVSATAFVEETYMIDSNDNIVVLESRLLSEEEVNEIGIEQFGDIGQSRQDAIIEAKQTRAAVQSRGKLTITFSGNYSISGNSVTCNLAGNASWSGGYVVLMGETTPAPGDDFIGIVWSGGFTLSSSSKTPGIDNWPIYMADSEPNAGIVWGFEEFVGDPTGLIVGPSLYLPRIDVNATLHKNNMTGGGNTAEAVLKYVHTYQSLAWAAEISSSGVGFSVSPSGQQWSLACRITNIPY